MPVDWRQAFAEQAKSDYEMFERLRNTEAPFCHQLHYLQMATEKIAKAYLTPPGGARYPSVHNAFVKFVRTARTTFVLMNASGFTEKDHYRAYMRALVEKAKLVEDLSPEGPDHPNPEYPWESLNGIETPLSYSFDELRFDNPRMMKLLKFIAKSIAEV